jgi:hypothetical protein
MVTVVILSPSEVSYLEPRAYRSKLEYGPCDTGPDRAKGIELPHNMPDPLLEGVGAHFGRLEHDVMLVIIVHVVIFYPSLAFQGIVERRSGIRGKDFEGGGTELAFIKVLKRPVKSTFVVMVKTEHDPCVR